MLSQLQPDEIISLVVDNALFFEKFRYNSDFIQFFTDMSYQDELMPVFVKLGML